MTFNVDGLTMDKQLMVCDLVAELGLDLVTLVDVRATKKQWPGIRRKLSDQLRRTQMAWRFHFVEGAISGHRCTIGGQVVFHNDRLQKASFHEVTKLGATTRLDCMVGNEKYTSLGTY